jgi:hypothetical protein
MSNWSLPALLDALQQSVESELRRARSALGHPTEKGDASESVWIDVLNAHLPRRYEARKAHVVDSRGAFSEQIDVVIHDRQYSPLVFRLKESFIVPVESVYAVFEAKQDLTGDTSLTHKRKSRVCGGCTGPACPSRQSTARNRRKTQPGYLGAS